MKFYIASRLDNIAAAQYVRDMLTGLGHTVTYDWTIHGSVVGRGEAVLGRVALDELRGVEAADTVLALLPGGRGTHAEIGAALVLGCPVVLWHPDGRVFLDTTETCAFYWHPGVAARLSGALIDVVRAVDQWSKSRIFA